MITYSIDPPNTSSSEQCVALFWPCVFGFTKPSWLFGSQQTMITYFWKVGCRSWLFWLIHPCCSILRVKLSQTVKLKTQVTQSKTPLHLVSEFPCLTEPKNPTVPWPTKCFRYAWLSPSPLWWPWTYAPRRERWTAGRTTLTWKLSMHRMLRLRMPVSTGLWPPAQDMAPIHILLVV